MQATKRAPEVETVEFMDTTTLRLMLSDALLFASKDWARPILTAVRFEADAAGQVLAIAATDSYTLIERTAPWPAASGTWQATVAREHVELLVKLLRQRDGLPVTVRVDDRSMHVETASVVLSVPLVEGTYPNWRKLLVEAGAGKNEKFHLNPTFMARLGKLSVAKLERPLKVTGQGALRPVIFEADTVRILILPVRVN